MRNSYKTTAILAFLSCGTALAEIRLLTGDSANQIHARGSTLMDLSSDGDRILFATQPPASGSTPGITAEGLYIRQMTTGTLAFASDAAVPDPGTLQASLSDDGRYVAWSTTNGQIYWRDVQGNITRKVTVGADDESLQPVISGNGRYVAFLSRARNLIADTTKLPAVSDPKRSAVYRYDSQTQGISIISLAHDGAGLPNGVGAAANPLNSFDFSADGQFLVFSTNSSNVHPDYASMVGGFFCVCRRNLTNGQVTLLNRNGAGAVANGNFTAPRTNATGSRTAFIGHLVGVIPFTNTMTSGPGQGFDIYAKDSGTGQVWWASRTTNGAAHTGEVGPFPAISGDGAVVAFASTSAQLSSDDTDSTSDAFRADLATGGTLATTLISKPPIGTEDVQCREGPFLPGTGNYVAFVTDQLTPMLGVPNPFSSNFQGVGVGILPVLPSTALTFETWAAVLPEGKRGPNDNPAGDGVPNLVKYFMGMNGAVPDLSRLPVGGSQTGIQLGLPGDAARYLTLQVRIRRELPAGYLWKVCAAGDIAGLASDAGSAVQVGSPTADGDFDVYLFRYPTPMAGRGFMNVRTVLP